MGVTIGDYFENVWKPNIDQYYYSGWRILSQIKPRDYVLDVGCGFNLFKQALGDRLVGIDPYNNAADKRVSIEEFNSNQKFDVILCLGSINFGDEETILKQIECVKSHCNADTRIFWRQNPGLKDHKNEECKDIDFFDWSFEKNIRYADMFGFRVEMLVWDNGRRIYSEWKRR